MATYSEINKKRETDMKEIERYIKLNRIWQAEGFDDDDDMNEFWELAKKHPELHQKLK